LKGCHSGYERANQAFGVQPRRVVVDGRQDGGICNGWVLGYGKMCDKRSKGKAHYGELVRLSKGTCVLAGLDDLSELNEDGLLLAKLVCEARDSA
jgi:hypothetical protein